MVRRRSVPRLWTDEESRILVDMMLYIGDVGERWEENIEMLPTMLQLGNTDLRLTQDQVIGPSHRVCNSQSGKCLLSKSGQDFHQKWMAYNGGFFGSSRRKFKVVLFKSPPMSDRLRLGPSEIFPGLMFLRTVLVDKIGDTIPVSLQRIEGKLYIHDGWEDFYDTHSLRRGDVVMFALRDNDVLEVKCFCWCSIERDDFEGRQTHRHHLHPSVFYDDESAAGGPHEEAYVNVPDENEMVEGQPIPAEAAAFFDRGKTDITLSTVAGDNFEVKLVNGEHNRAFSGGWNQFAVHNELTLADTLVFEIIDKKRVRIHLYR
ncbi:hypothetical protein COLO4_08240 [Corchorus olitorius]|uniref:TF-B3 domain-containing protein n=1 Tax=Corchorus olitorius TaxID=93759 RepID=A0A1R3KGQ0_9ROSI|nr:hypothetical protein COLO4_08240 [Corchorus olitorius]